MRVSTRGDYACRALLSLTLHAGEPGPTSVRDIADRTGLPQPYLEQILLALKGAGLVKSKRGVGGGYTLARTPEEIRLNDIISAVDGPITLGDFGEPHQDGSCDHEGQCVLLAIWKQTGDHMHQHTCQWIGTRQRPHPWLCAGESAQAGWCASWRGWRRCLGRRRDHVRPRLTARARGAAPSSCGRPRAVPRPPCGHRQ